MRHPKVKFYTRLRCQIIVVIRHKSWRTSHFRFSKTNTIEFASIIRAEQTALEASEAQQEAKVAAILAATFDAKKMNANECKQMQKNDNLPKCLSK